MAFNEGMVLATKGGVDPQADAGYPRRHSAAKSGLIAYKAPIRLPPRLHGELLRTKWMHKDIGLMLESRRGTQACPYR
jgi:3-hydroxyisobutyrate dehydrogenase-like beta-hydroxyacid dehydrogenase